MLHNFLEKCGNLKMTTLKFNCTFLKQDLKSKTEKLKYQNRII